jgi:hypothetical protein
LCKQINKKNSKDGLGKVAVNALVREYLGSSLLRHSANKYNK